MNKDLEYPLDILDGNIFHLLNELLEFEKNIKRRLSDLQVSLLNNTEDLKFTLNDLQNRYSELVKQIKDTD